jgi:hypothetical protein
METAIFAYLGLFLFTDNEWSFRLNMTALFGVVSSRGVMVVALSLLINIFVFFDVEGMAFGLHISRASSFLVYSFTYEFVPLSNL